MAVWKGIRSTETDVKVYAQDCSYRRKGLLLKKKECETGEAENQKEEKNTLLSDESRGIPEKGHPQLLF